MIRSTELIQEIDIYTEKRNILRLRIGETNSGYRLYGDCYDNDNKQFTSVVFDDKRGNDCNELFSDCIKNLSDTLKGKNDRIVRLHNPSTTPFITAQQERAILDYLYISAVVEVN